MFCRKVFPLSLKANCHIIIDRCPNKKMSRQHSILLPRIKLRFDYAFPVSARSLHGTHTVGLLDSDLPSPHTTLSDYITN